MARQSIDVRMMQNIRVIWLDTTINQSGPDYHHQLSELQRVINVINTFTDRDQCVDFLTDIDTEQVFLITSGPLSQKTMPNIHDIPQLHAIFILDDNTMRHQQWINEWPKIKGVFTHISLICDVLNKTSKQCEQNAIPMSFIDTSGNGLKKKLDQLDPSFMYTQIIKEILLTITFEDKHRQEFLACCHELFTDNQTDMKNVSRFVREYEDQTPVRWYTGESFLYSMLNRALRMMDVHVIVNIGFFIADLHHYVKRLHAEQFSEHLPHEMFTVYRGQGLSEIDFDRLAKTKGGLLSFNSFLSTSKDRTVSHAFAESNSTNPDLVGILFVMTVDPSKSSTPFAFIASVSSFEEEDEILFSMHTVFRIHDVKSLSENQRLFQVDLTLTAESDNDLRVLTDYIRKESSSNAGGWYHLGHLLLGMGESAKAHDIHINLLKQTPTESSRAGIYNELGFAECENGEYEKAICWYDKALAIRQQSLPHNHPSLATSQNNIGGVYLNMGEYSRALLSYNKALAIQQQSLPPNHPDLARSYNNTGTVYCDMREYSKALLSFDKTLAIQQLSLPPNHPDLARSQNNIGMLYCYMGEYSKGLLSYNKALAIQQQSLPPNHPHLATSYTNIGAVYLEMSEYLKTLSSFNKALAIRQHSLPPNHPDLATSHNNIGIVYSKMSEYLKARSYFKHAVNIAQHCLPPQHPDLQLFRNNLDRS